MKWISGGTTRQCDCTLLQVPGLPGSTTTPRDVGAGQTARKKGGGAKGGSAAGGEQRPEYDDQYVPRHPCVVSWDPHNSMKIEVPIFGVTKQQGKAAPDKRGRLRCGAVPPAAMAVADGADGARRSRRANSVAGRTRAEEPPPSLNAFAPGNTQVRALNLGTAHGGAMAPTIFALPRDMADPRGPAAAGPRRCARRAEPRAGRGRGGSQRRIRGGHEPAAVRASAGPRDT